MGKHETFGKIPTAKRQKKENNDTDHERKNEQQQGTSNVQEILDEQVLFDPAVQHISKQNIQQLPLNCNTKKKENNNTSNQVKNEQQQQQQQQQQIINLQLVFA